MLEWDHLPRSPKDLPVASPGRRQDASVRGLKEALSAHSAEIRTVLADAGVLLLRGWAVRSEQDFQLAMLALGWPPLSDYFPREAGRRPLGQPGCEYVWPTNSLRQTGAYLSSEVLPHTENYYAVQMPRYVCFWCHRPAWFGGDTCLIDSASVFDDLPKALQHKLSRSAFRIRRVVSREDLKALYGIHGSASLQRLREEYAQRGVRLQPHPADTDAYELVEFQKPSVLQSSSRTGRRQTSICFNFGECGVAAREALLAGLKRRGFFNGPKWAIHRSLWLAARRWPVFRSFLGHLDAIWLFLLDASQAFRRWRHPPPHSCVKQTLGDSLSRKQQERLGSALASHTYAFHWRRGDILLLDNTRTLHDGLPGFGLRRLRVILLGELKLPQSLHRLHCGVFAIDDETH